MSETDELRKHNIPTTQELLWKGANVPFITDQENSTMPRWRQIVNSALTWMGGSYVLKSREPVPIFTVNRGPVERAQPFNYRDYLILSKTHWLIRQIIRAITGEVINPGWTIEPRFRHRCRRCGKEHQNPEVKECDVCDGKRFDKPDVNQFIEFQSLLKHPSKSRTFTEFIRSTLWYHVALDDSYWEVGHTSNGEPRSIRTLDASITRPVMDEYGYFNSNEYFCPRCYKDQYRATKRDTVETVYPERGDPIPACKSCGGPMRITAYKQSFNGVVIARFTEEEVVHTSHGRIDPEFYGYSKMVAIIKHLLIIDAMDEFNLQVYTKGHADKIIALPKADKVKIEEIEEHINNTLNANVRRDARTGSQRRSQEPAIIFLGTEEGSVPTAIDIMPAFSALQSIEFYRLYVEKVSGVFGVTPIFTNTTESSPQGQMARPRIDVQNRVTKEYMSNIEEPFNNMLLPKFGITDWILCFGKIESRDEFRDAQKRQTVADTAVRLYEGGWDVELTPDVEELIVDPKPKRPPPSTMRERGPAGRTKPDGTERGNPTLEPEDGKR